MFAFYSEEETGVDIKRRFSETLKEPRGLMTHLFKGKRLEANSKANAKAFCDVLVAPGPSGRNLRRVLGAERA